MNGFASSFADLADRRAYERAVKRLRAQGLSKAQAEKHALKEGDPGIGWLDNDLTDEGTPWVAVPYECWKERFSTKALAHRVPIDVTINDVTKRCVLGDTMPRLANIRNGAVIDLAPGAQRAFGLSAPFLLPCSWHWA